MRVLHVIETMGSGGAEKLLDESLPEISKLPGFQVDILILDQTRTVFLNKIRNSRVKVIYSPFKNSRSLRNISFIRQHIKINNYDIVHSHLFPALYFVAIASLFDRGNRKYIFTEHNTENRRRNVHLLRPFEKFIYSKYDFTTCITKATQEKLMKWLETDDFTKFPVINNGIDLDKYYNAKPYSKKELITNIDLENKKILCMVGRFTPQKDQETIIRSLNYLSQDVHLLLIGEGPKKKNLKKLAEEIHVSDRVHFMGLRSDVPNLYKTSDIGIVSSNWEGFGLVAAEAMASELPVVASDVPGLNEVVGDAGVLFEKNNDKELAFKINRLFSDDLYYLNISRNCYKKSKEYGIEKMIRKYISLYTSASYLEN